MSNLRKLSVSIIGGGNVAFHLVNFLCNKEEIEVKQLCNLSGFTSHFDAFTFDKITNISDLKVTDICIIAVKDEAIAEVSQALPFSNTLVIHTSGNTNMNVIDDKNRRGVFYPLQSFSKTKKIDFEYVPICIETENDQDFTLLRRFTEIFTSKIYKMDSHQRKMLHISAVFVNNFTNHLVEIGHKICKENSIPTEILSPLLSETFEKLEKLSPYDAQTGPARRGDKQTIENHIALLNGKEKEIYIKITDSILKTYGR